ncbi:MAG TPA: V-type ATP synthase subunit E [Bacillota bacterium]|nr:V-type ATP synthase subunit E [Bacillota bacterium]HPQ61762.1 V-type ATP synthase subunit E [Bacillota bacterium]
MDYYTNDQLYKYFEDEIIMNAGKQMKALKAEIDDLKKKALEKIKSDLSESSQTELAAKIRDMETDHSQELNRISYDYSHKLMQKRQEYMDQIFAVAKTKLQDFANGPEYTKMMKSNLVGIYTKLSGGKIDFRIRKGDENLAGIIKDTCKEQNTVSEDPAIKIGGFVALSEKHALQIDETIDSALESRKEWFYSRASLLFE